MIDIFAQNEQGWRWAAWEYLKMIDKHNQEYDLGNQSFAVAMNAFGDMMSVASIAELWVLPLLSSLTKNCLTFLMFYFLLIKDQWRIQVGDGWHYKAKAEARESVPRAFSYWDQPSCGREGERLCKSSEGSGRTVLSRSASKNKARNELNLHACLGALWNSL